VSFSLDNSKLILWKEASITCKIRYFLEQGKRNQRRKKQDNQYNRVNPSDRRYIKELNLNALKAEPCK
jgi:hypothetical protein